MLRRILRAIFGKRAVEGYQPHPGPVNPRPPSGGTGEIPKSWKHPEFCLGLKITVRVLGD